MADESDIVNAFKSIIVQKLYPTGVPGNGITPVTGTKVSAMGGWPLPAQVDRAMSLGECIVSIFPRAEEKNTSRMRQAYLPKSQAVPGTTVAVDALTVRFGGAPAPGDVVTVWATSTPGLAVLDYTTILDTMVLTDPSAEQITGYSYAVNQGDTPTTIAAAFAALMPGATSSGPALQVPAINVRAAVYGAWTVVRETSRQEKAFQITVWAPKYDMRDMLAKALRPVLDLAYRINLPDGTQTTTRYARSHQADELQKQMIYQRHFIYFAEFATTTPDELVAPVTVPTISITPQ